MKSTPAAISVAVGVSVYTVVLGIIYPYLAINLAEAGTPKSLIGINASMVPIGLLCASLSYKYLLRLLSPFQIAIYSITLSAIVLAAIFSFEKNDGYSGIITAWMPLCILLGFVVNGLFIIGEAWINRLAPENIRGRVLGFYTTALIAGYGVGPLLISLVGHDGLSISIASVLLIILALSPIFAFRSILIQVSFGDTEKNDRPVSNWSFIRSNGLIVVCFASIAVFDNVAVSFMPVYFSGIGFDITQASWFLSLIIFGGAALQPLVGFVADRFSNLFIMLISSILTICLCFVVIALGEVWYLSVVLLIWGGAAFANYTLALKELGDRYDDERLVTGSAVLAMTWSLVTIVGLPAIGASIDIFGLFFFPMIICLVYPLVIVLTSFQFLSKDVR